MLAPYAKAITVGSAGICIRCSQPHLLYAVVAYQKEEQEAYQISFYVAISKMETKLSTIASTDNGCSHATPLASCCRSFSCGLFVV